MRNILIAALAEGMQGIDCAAGPQIHVRLLLSKNWGLQAWPVCPRELNCLAWIGCASTKRGVQRIRRHCESPACPRTRLQRLGGEKRCSTQSLSIFDAASRGWGLSPAAQNCIAGFSDKGTVELDPVSKNDYRLLGSHRRLAKGQPS